jgi:4-hydroxy-tetrahydrodipicolinate synthase
VISPVTPTTWLTGYIPDLPARFDHADRIDLRALERLCGRQIAAGVSAMVACETAGEAPTLSTAERDTIIRAAVEITRGRARIIAGAGSNSTSRVIELTRRAEAAGADAVLSVVPYYNKPMQNGLYAHFQAIAASTELPVILHDIPARTIRELADDTLIRLTESKKFIGLRDGTGDVYPSDAVALHAAAELSDDVRARRDSIGLCCRRGRWLHFNDVECDAGPLLRSFFSNLTQGRLQIARYLQKRLAPLEAFLSNDIPAAVKYALSLLGLMDSGTRLPIVPLAGPAKAAIAKAIAGIDDDLAGAAEG